MQRSCGIMNKRFDVYEFIRQQRAEERKERREEILFVVSIILTGALLIWLTITN